MEGLGEFGVVTHPVAGAADVNDVAVMDEAIDECSGHDVVAKDFAPFLETFVGSEDRGGDLVTAVDELEEEHGTGRVNR